MQTNSVRLILLITAVFFSLSLGCQTPMQQRLTTPKGEEVKLSAFELRVAALDLAPSFSDIIEEAADEIIEKSADPKIRRHALVWKMNAIPAAFTAIFRPDPVAAIIDTWAFSIQMVQFFDKGDGRRMFGEYNYIALDGSKRLEAEVLHIIKSSVSPELEAELKKKIEWWASEHPMEGQHFHRQSIMPDYARFMGDPNFGVFALVDKLTVGLPEIANRLSVYNEYLPRQARWQAELLVDEVNEKEGIKVQMEELAGLMEVLNSVIPLVEQIPDLIARERVALLKALREERVASFESIDQQRVATLDKFTQERIATIAALREERIATLQDIDAIGNQIVTNALTKTEGLIDHTFLRTSQLLAALLILCFIAGVVLVLFIKKK